MPKVYTLNTVLQSLKRIQNIYILRLFSTYMSGRRSNNKSFLRQVWDFLKERKAWWLTPIIIMLIIVALLIIFAHSSPLSPFIYALF